MRKADIKRALLGVALGSLVFTSLTGCVVEPYPVGYVYREPYVYRPYYYRPYYYHDHYYYRR